MNLMDLLLIFLLCELVLRANALSPTELFCADPDCTTPFSYGIIIQDINTADGILLKKDSPVDIVGKGETAKASIMRVKISDRFAILESSFVREVGETDVKTLKKYVFSGSEPNVRKNATPSSAAVLQTMHHSKMPETDSSTVGTGSTATIDSLPVAPSEANKTMPRLEAPKTRDIGSHGSAPKAPDILSDDQRKLTPSHEKQSPAEIPVDTNSLLNASSENGLKAATVGQHETSGAIDVVERSAGSVTRSSASTTRHEVEELGAEKKVGRATKSKVLTTDQEQADELERTQSTSSSLKMRDDAKVYESETHPDNVVVTAASNDDKQSSFTQDDSSIRNDKSRRRSTDGTSLSGSPTASGDFRNGEEARDTHEHFDETSPNMSESSVTGNSPGSLSNQETESEDIDREDSFKSVTQEPIHEFEDTMEQTSPYTPEDSVTKTQPSVIPNPELEVKDNDGRDPFRRETQDHPTTWNLDAVQQRDAADSQLTGQLPAEEDETSEKARGKDTALEKKETDVEILGLSSEPTINGGEGESIDYYPAFSPSPSSNDTAAPSAQDDGSMLSGERELSSTAESRSQRQGALPMEKMAGSSTNTSTIEESDMISHKTSSSELVNRSEENIISTGGPDYGVQNEVESANKDDTDMVDSHTESPVSPSLDSNPAVSSNTGSLSNTSFVPDDQPTFHSITEGSSRRPAKNTLGELETPHQSHSDPLYDSNKTDNSGVPVEPSDNRTGQQMSSTGTPEISPILPTSGDYAIHVPQSIAHDKPVSSDSFSELITNNTSVQHTETLPNIHTDASVHAPFFQPATSFPSQVGLIQCIAWAANQTVNSDTSTRKLRASPLARLIIHGVNYFFWTSDIILLRMPTGWRLSIDGVLTDFLDLPLSVLMAWIVFVLHVLIGWMTSQLFWSMLFKQSYLHSSDKLSSTHFLQVEERALQLASRLADQEETNSQLATWAAQMTLDLQQAQREKSAAIDTLNERIQTTEAELDAVQSRLTESLTKITELKETYKLKLADSEQSLSLLRSELSTLTEEKLASEESWKSRLTALEESNQKALEEAKREHEELYYQALDYYGRMKAMRPEMDKLLEARRQAEDRLATTEAELDSLRTTFTTLRSFELALEQEHLIDGNQESRVSPESSGYTVISPPRDEDDSGEVCMDSDKQQLPDGQDGFADDAAQAVDVNTGKTNLEQLKSKLQTNLAIFLDTGRLQAKLDVATSQLKSEQAKSQCERQLREELESKVESMERETAELRQKYDLIQEDRNTIQTKLDVLSAYFKERELELQRDLGKHVVVGSESSEALNTCRKRNKELEAEVRALREQVAALRRELAETERVGRRQIAELDKRSHENWLSARAADHQVQELRDENACLRQKLMEAERSTLPPALRAQVLAPARPFLAGPSPPRPNIPPLLSSNPGSSDKRSVSGQSLTSLSSQPPLLRPDLPGLPFPPPPLGFPSDIPPPPPPPFLLQGRLPFPHGFPPPPPPPPPGTFTAQLNTNALAHQSPSSSVSGSTKSRPFI